MSGIAFQEVPLLCCAMNMNAALRVSRPNRLRGTPCADEPRSRGTIAALALVAMAPLAAVVAAEPPQYTIRILNHQFVPASLQIPRGVKVCLIIDNEEDTPEEFDSHSLNREKHLMAHERATIYIGPLSAGRYVYESESDVAGGAALGVIVVQ